jgi:hypothetical protein
MIFLAKIIAAEEGGYCGGVILLRGLTVTTYKLHAYRSFISPNLNFIERLWHFLKKYIIGIKWKRAGSPDDVTRQTTRP